MNLKLPAVFDAPVQHPECCASLSSKLLNSVVGHLPCDDSLVLSIGCGTGLFEALLLQLQPRLKLCGLEVSSRSVNYLSPKLVNAVAGTWDISPLAAIASVWLLIYPRAPSLVASYLQAYQTGKVGTIIWIGPQNDWPDFEAVFSASMFNKFLHVTESGLKTYEDMVVIKRQISQTRYRYSHAVVGASRNTTSGIDDI